MIDRRTVLLTTASAAALPGVALAQTPKPPGKIGYLHQGTIDPRNATLRVMRPHWQRLGYVEGETVLLRAAENDQRRLPDLVAELIMDGCGVLIVIGAEAVRVAAKATTTTPIVAADLETDPVATGLIQSYARPGGNVTGLFLDQPSLAAKWIELIREAVPGLERVVFVWQPLTGRAQLDLALATARTMGLEPVVLEFEFMDDFAVKLAGLGASKRTALVQLTTPGFNPVAARYGAAAVQYGLPTMTFLRTLVQEGVLMSHGPNQEVYWPRAVELADKILRGAKVAETPIERPAKFEFVINMKTARALGLTLSPTLLLRADEVLE